MLLLTRMLRMMLFLAHVQGRMTLQGIGLLLFAGIFHIKWSMSQTYSRVLSWLPSSTMMIS